jgi:hypothetical protein
MGKQVSVAKAWILVEIHDAQADPDGLDEEG